MNTFWQSKTGRLMLGGCGTQIGMVFTCGSVILIAAFCAICATTNVLTISLSQHLAQGSPTGTPAVTVNPSADNNEIDTLLQEVTFLLGEIERLQATAAAAPPPTTAAPASPRPVVVAIQTGVNLRSGPGTQYNKVGILRRGKSLEVIGRNDTATWWLVSTSEGLFAWVSGQAVSAFNISKNVPVVTIPSLLVQPAASGSLTGPTPEPPAPATSPTSTPTPTITPTPTLPPGTPTPSIEEHRVAAPDTVGYQALTSQLLVPPVSTSFSPNGEQIVITERIKVYTVASEGGSGRIWLEEDDKMGPIGGAVWSPDGKQIAFVVGFKHKYCRPCRAVALLTVEEETIELLTPPEEHLETDMPRWTQDGRLLVNAHPGEPADGVAYVYNRFGQIEPATGVYVLSSSHEGQKWYPWKTGRVWRAGVSERADSYNSD